MGRRKNRILNVKNRVNTLFFCIRRIHFTENFKCKKEMLIKK